MAYGARLESVLGASPRGFESPILRQLSKKPLTLFEALFFGYFINSFFNSSVASFLSFSLDYGSSVFFPH